MTWLSPARPRFRLARTLIQRCSPSARTMRASKSRSRPVSKRAREQPVHALAVVDVHVLQEHPVAPVLDRLRVAEDLGHARRLMAVLGADVHRPLAQPADLQRVGEPALVLAQLPLDLERLPQIAGDAHDEAAPRGLVGQQRRRPAGGQVASRAAVDQHHVGGVRAVLQHGRDQPVHGHRGGVADDVVQPQRAHVLALVEPQQPPARGVDRQAAPVLGVHRDGLGQVLHDLGELHRPVEGGPGAPQRHESAGAHAVALALGPDQLAGDLAGQDAAVGVDKAQRQAVAVAQDRRPAVGRPQQRSVVGVHDLDDVGEAAQGVGLAPRHGPHRAVQPHLPGARVVAERHVAGARERPVPASGRRRRRPAPRTGRSRLCRGSSGSPRHGTSRARAAPGTGTMYRSAPGRGPPRRACRAAGPVGPRLLDRDGLREIPRLVHVGALDQGDVVGQQLQRHGVDDRRDDRVAVRAPRAPSSSRRRRSGRRGRRTRTSARRARAPPRRWT